MRHLTYDTQGDQQRCGHRADYHRAQGRDHGQYAGDDDLPVRRRRQRDDVHQAQQHFLTSPHHTTLLCYALHGLSRGVRDCLETADDTVGSTTVVADEAAVAPRFQGPVEAAARR